MTGLFYKVCGQKWEVLALCAHNRKDHEMYTIFLKFVEVKLECLFSQLGPLTIGGVHQKCLIVMDLDKAEHNAADAIELVSAECTFHVIKNLSGKTLYPRSQ